MPLKNTQNAYGWLAITLHWVSALCIFGLFGLGLWMSDLDYYHAWYTKAPDLHRSVGFLLVMLTAFRLVWRSLNPAPNPAPAPVWQLKAAVAVHYLFYGLLFLMLVSGYFITTAEGKPLEVFNWFSIPSLITEEHMEDVAGEIHEFLAFTLIGLSALHAAAALKHHFIDKDSTLKKMLGIAR